MRVEEEMFEKAFGQSVEEKLRVTGEEGVAARQPAHPAVNRSFSKSFLVILILLGAYSSLSSTLTVPSNLSATSAQCESAPNGGLQRVSGWSGEGVFL